MPRKPKQQGYVRLLSKHNWSKFIDYFDDEPLEHILNRLDNYSLFLLHEHFYGLTCDVFLRRKECCYKYCNVIKIIANSRKFNIWEKPPQNLSLPDAPLKRYKGENWVNYPNGSLDFK